MPSTVQFRRGTTAQNNAFTGAVGEITVDTDKETVVVHDGVTAGGFPLISSADTAPAFTSSSASLPEVTLKNTADDATGPIITFESDRATPANNDVAGTIQFKASDDAGAQTTIATIQALISDVTNLSEDGKITFNTYAGGSDTTIATIDATGVTINSGILAATTGSTVGNLTLANGSITDSSGTISFGDENLTTTGTATAGTITIGSGSITDSSGAISFGNENLTTTGTITGGIGVFDNIRIDNTAGEIDTSSGNLTIDSAGGTVTVDDNLSVSGNATVTGNLTVNGTTTTLATTNSVITDTLIELGNGTTGTPLNDAGIVIERGDSNNAFIGFDESADKFIVGTGTFTGASTGDLTITTGTLVANIEGTSANMTGTVTYGSLSDGTITITAFADEDNMASNSATLVPTQQSVKAYVDSAVSSISSSGTAAVATTVTLVATNTTAATHYVTFVDAATGNENIRTDTDLTYNPSTNVLGTTASSAQYADLAELYSADQEYEPGTVMSFGGDSEITQSVLSHDVKVAGVVSTAPAYLMNAELENGTALALQGRTPVKVIGRIHKGDMLVASQTPGVACAMDPSSYTPGCVIGKALESYDSDTVGVIEVVVGRI